MSAFVLILLYEINLAYTYIFYLISQCPRNEIIRNYLSSLATGSEVHIDQAQQILMDLEIGIHFHVHFAAEKPISRHVKYKVHMT